MPAIACCSSHSRAYRSFTPAALASSADVDAPASASTRYPEPIAKVDAEQVHGPQRAAEEPLDQFVTTCVSASSDRHAVPRSRGTVVAAGSHLDGTRQLVRRRSLA